MIQYHRLKLLDKGLSGSFVALPIQDCFARNLLALHVVKKRTSKNVNNIPGSYIGLEGIYIHTVPLRCIYPRMYTHMYTCCCFNYRPFYHLCTYFCETNFCYIHMTVKSITCKLQRYMYIYYVAYDIEP